MSGNETLSFVLFFVMKKDPGIDTYINKSADSMQAILNHFRKLIHQTCPELEETIKWGFPHFNYKGNLMCYMASFKQHCAIGFWKAPLMVKSKELNEMAKTEAAMGHLGKISSLRDLPKDQLLIKYIREAMKLNEQGVPLPSKSKPAKKKELVVPDYFMKNLIKNKKALKTFETFSYSNKKEYVEWVTSAKTEVTRAKRLTDAVLWMSEGKIRNWKYVKAR